MELAGTQYYRTEDPVENLKMRVRIRQLKAPRPEGASERDKDAKTPPAQHEEVAHTFGWQEKRLGPREIALYGEEWDDRRVASQLEAEYRERVANEQLAPDPAAAVALFSYVDKDGVVLRSEMGNGPMTPLAAAQLDARRLATAHDSAKGSHLSRAAHETRVMHLMASVEGGYEKALCTVRYRSGVLEAQPGFARIDEELDDGEAEDDAAAANGEGEEGPAEREVVLTSHKFSTPRGGVYEFCVENLSAIEDDALEAKLTRALRQQQQDKFHQWSNRIGTTLHGVPPPFYAERVHAFCEIVSATGFGGGGGDALYVHWEVVVPPGWKFAVEAEPGAGTTQVSRTRVVPRRGPLPVAHFGYCVDLEFVGLGLARPTLYFQVMSTDSWERHRLEGYGFAALPHAPGAHDLVVSTWRPQQSLQAQARSFFIGGSTALTSLRDAATPASHDGHFLSKYGVRTESSGDLRVRLGLVQQTAPEKGSETQPRLAALLRKRAGARSTTGSTASSASGSRVSELLERSRRLRERRRGGGSSASVAGSSVAGSSVAGDTDSVAGDSVAGSSVAGE